MSAEPIDYVAIQAEHDFPAWAPAGANRCRKCGQTWPCDAYRCAEDAKRLADELWQHALANGGCVPLPAYEECGAEVQRLAGKVTRVEAKADEWSKSPGAAANAAARVLRVALADQPEQV